MADCSELVVQAGQLVVCTQEAADNQFVPGLLVLLGALVAGVVTYFTTVGINRREVSRSARIRIYTELLPEFVEVGGQRFGRVYSMKDMTAGVPPPRTRPDVLADIERLADVAGRSDRAQVEELRAAYLANKEALTREAPKPGPDVPPSDVAAFREQARERAKNDMEETAAALKEATGQLDDYLRRKIR